MLKIILMWFLFIPVPILNGVLREKWYKQKIGDFGANIVGFLALSGVFLLYTYQFFGSELAVYNNVKAFSVGAAWLVFTLAFEFGLGYITGKSLKYLLADYNILRGRLWPLVLTTIFFAPYIIKILVAH